MGKQQLRIIEEMSKARVRMGGMLRPMIPSLNDHEIYDILKAEIIAGATFSTRKFTRLNGALKLSFHD